jgi:hypothetical protein
MTELESIEHQHAIRLARWSAALGTLGLLTAVFGVGVLLALVAIGCATVALNHLATLRTEDARGVAFVGLAAGVLALLVFPLLVATAVPRFLAGREEANHEKCYSNLVAIDALRVAAARDRTSPGASSDPSWMAQPELRERLQCPSGGKYRMNGARARCSIPMHNQPPGETAPPRRLRFS